MRPEPLCTAQGVWEMLESPQAPFFWSSWIEGLFDKMTATFSLRPSSFILLAFLYVEDLP